MKAARASIEVQVAGLNIDPFTNMPVVVLRDASGKYELPIWIGLVEASAIATQLEKIQLARPMTHDLLRRLLDETGTKLVRVEVSDLKDDTFFATLHLTVGDRAVTIDSRPSDAIALALRTGAPIFVSEQILEQARKSDEATDAHSAEQEKASEKPSIGSALAGQPPARWAEILESLSPEDFGKFKM